MRWTQCFGSTLVCLLAMLIFCFPKATFSQLPDLSGKRMGVYISSKNIDFNDNYYMWISQFLKVEEDRSYGENMKAEFMIKMGEKLVSELRNNTSLDSIYFINADQEKAKTMIRAFNYETGDLIHPGQGFTGTDYILVLSELDLKTRESKVVYIRSNKFVTHRVNVKKAQLGMSLFELRNINSPRKSQTCFDEKESDNPPDLLDFYRQESNLGKFLSELYSFWWLQLSQGVVNNCE